MSRSWLVALSLIITSGSVAYAQEGKPSAAGMALFRQAYELTKGARSEADFSKVVDLCQQGFENTLSEPDEKYGKNLMAWSLNRRGEVRAAAGKEEEALADFESSLNFDPNRWAAYHNRGVSLGSAGRYEEALADFNRVLKMKPDHAKAFFNRGEIRFNQGDLAGALEDYNQCLRLAPSDAAAMNSRGFVYYSQRNYRAAIREYTQAIQVNGNHAEAYTNRGDAQADLGQFQPALRDYQSALRVDPKYGRAYQSAAWLRATCPDPQVRNPAIAVQSAQRAIELDGETDYRYLDALAAAFASSSQFQEAQVAVAKALTLAEEAKAPAEKIAAIERRKKLYEESKPYRDLPPTNPPSNVPPTTVRRR